MKKLTVALILSSLFLASCGRLEISMITSTPLIPTGTPTAPAAATETPMPYFVPSFTPPRPPWP